MGCSPFCLNITVQRFAWLLVTSQDRALRLRRILSV